MTDELRQFVAKMVEVMYKADGIGLATPQVGRNLRLVTLGLHLGEEHLDDDASPGERVLCRDMPVVLVNPRILWRSDDRGEAEEGCLSIPGIHANVPRPTRLLLHTDLLDGHSVQLECGGWLARCLQHEIDHLDGVLFVDRVSPDESKAIAPELKSLEKRTRRRLAGVRGGRG
jgi:peptide deformylase